ncbi:HSP70-domain-containing protein, partial [Neocallimastix lanati (nom. inval.)]
MTVPDKIILAIDLGTTYCCSAIYRNGEITIIPILLDDDDHNDDDDDSNDSQNDKYSKNDTTMPSYVTIFNDNVLVGWDSKEQSLIHIDNTVYDIKRIIGKSYADKQLFHDKKFWSFKIINNCGKPYIQTEYMKELKENSPEQISAKLLEKIK